jgi:hypothetical protein
VLDELDKSKKGVEPVNVKTREVIRYLERRNKARPSRMAESATTGSLRMQAPEDLFTDWAECEKLSLNTEDEKLSKDEIPRHFRAMANCVLFQRSKGIKSVLVTEDEELISLTAHWDIIVASVDDLDKRSSKALDKFRQEMKAYETRERNAARSNSPKQRMLWAPVK